MADFDGDGKLDILSGSWPGELYLFRRKADGTFATGEHIKGRDGNLLIPGKASVVFAADWFASGKLDLIAGTMDGSVRLYRNEGTATAPVYAPGGVPLEADGKPITAPHGDSGPVVADWDGDGLPDLVVGCGDGSVRWYRNVGTRGEPKLKDAGELIAKPPEEKESDEATPRDTRGSRAKVCVTDWDGDGRPDLLVGDFVMLQGPARKLTPAEEAEKTKAEADAEKKSEALKPYFEELSKLPEGDAPAEKAERERKSAEIEKKYADAMAAQRTAFEKVRAYDRPMEYTGHVRLYLRKPKA